MTIENAPFFCSWSGGKDSCLSLYRAVKAGGRPKFLFTMLAEDGEKSRSHGLPLSVLQSQARSLGIPLIVRSASWEDYTGVFIDALYEFKARGIEAGVFGDIDIEDHRLWVENVCKPVGIAVYHPLWQQSRRAILNEFIETGFKATVVVVQDGKLEKSILGETLDLALIDEIERQGADAAGEYGEYHTVVTDGPLFACPLPLEIGHTSMEDGYWFLTVNP